MNGKVSDDEFIQRLERRIKEVKANARNDGWKAGITQGKSLGFAEGSHQVKLEMAWLMLQRNYPASEICLMTGLTKEEVEAINL